eukprot:TRINITY_DN17747_c0_g1_i1.p3 TRINITY_DN17747_c0_g1~~TRINITY_DN17747_c0_g1_i1.p3  ORF type:complete len:105 (+),score=5.16 TRINITY_DN17747_c0_g1_i1:18-332(+)
METLVQFPSRFNVGIRTQILGFLSTSKHGQIQKTPFVGISNCTYVVQIKLSRSKSISFVEKLMKLVDMSLSQMDQVVQTIFIRQQQLIWLFTQYLCTGGPLSVV